jgi:glycosyltransferase involved in cell wall biosynthesis
LKISVVIPVYNRKQLITRALDSVFAQTSQPDEVIVVDDGSTDNSAHIISSRYPGIKLIPQQNKGVSAARNTGVRHAAHDWIALLDSDDEWLSNKLQVIRELHHRHPQERFFHSNEIWIRNGVRVNPMKKHQKQGGMIFQQCLPLCVISPSAVVMQKSLFDQTGPFDEALPACEDYDLWLRLCHRFPVFYIEQPLIKKYGGHSDQLSRKYWGMDRFRIRALQNVLQLPTLDEHNRNLTRNMLQRKLEILLKGARKHKNLELLNEFEPLLHGLDAAAC